jgi:hypothetical protein
MTIRVGALFALLFVQCAFATRVDIVCNGMNVGVVDIVPALDGARPGLSGGFATPVGSLAAAAALCGEHHFNWHQRVTSDNMPPVDAGGNRLVPPYDDPPPGGYGNDPTTGGDDTQWADDFPWYWDEGPDPPAGTPGFENGYNRLDNEPTGSMLRFRDFPGGPDGTRVTFSLALVSLNADNTLHSSYPILNWYYFDPLGPAGPIAAIPEPATLLLSGAVLILSMLRRRLAASR